MAEKLLEEIERRLKAKTIHDLRQIARAVGVPRPADGRKERILDYILQIATGESDPVTPSARGAHPKSAEYDRQLVADVLRCREISLSANETGERQEAEMRVGSGLEPDSIDFTATGILEKTDGRWFMRVNGCRENFISDIFVNDYFVNRFGLREGDLVSGKCKRPSPDELAGLAAVNSVNGVIPEALSPRADFDSLTPVYPEKRLRIEYSPQDVAGRIIDLLSPVGAGQRAVVCAPHGSGKTSILKDIARGLQKNNPKVKLIILLTDARPEEAADFKRTFADADVFTTLFDSGAALHVRTARLVLEYAKRQTEAKNDVVLVLDDLTRLTRAFNYCGKQVVNGLDTSALDGAKRFLCSARNAEEGGSLTIITALNSDGDPVDEAIYSGLKHLCNMRVCLSGQYARMRVYPPVIVEQTYASGDEKLLSEAELQTAVKLRGENLYKIIELIAHTGGNDELCKQLKG